MIRLSRILPLAAIAAIAWLAAAPAQAFVGYGVESGTPMYDALQHGYRPYPYHQYYYYAPQPRRWRRGPRRHR
jgi:hypothetical protein